MRLVDIDAVLDLFGIGDSDIYAKGTINDAVYDGTLKIYTQRKIGKWLYRIGWGGAGWICSECGERTVSAVMGKPRYIYCPICGAKMGDTDERYD